MGIRVYNQNDEIRVKFNNFIKEKVKRKVQEDSQKVKEKIDSIFGIGGEVFKPFIEAGLSFNNLINNTKGTMGEGIVRSIIASSRYLNRNNTTIINDVVLETAKNEFIQIDHIIISENGIFLVETKNWIGAYQGYRDKWKIKCSNGWKECKSPTSQHKRHSILFKKWIKNTFGASNDIEQFVYPVVLMGVSWLRVTNCSTMVVKGTAELLSYIENYKDSVLKLNLIEELTAAIINAKPIEDIENHANNEYVKIIENGVNKFGKRYVRLRGSVGQANEIVKEYAKKGHKVSDVKTDKYDDGIKYFYIL